LEDKFYDGMIFQKPVGASADPKKGNSSVKNGSSVKDKSAVPKQKPIRKF